MGNRAVITTSDKQMGVYLHWNGGRDSVEAFLKYCEDAGYRSPTYDSAYGWAMLTTVIGNYFGTGVSLGVDVYNNLDVDNGDNGLYIIKDWSIIGREYAPEVEQCKYDLQAMLIDIDKAQPKQIYKS